MASSGEDELIEAFYDAAVGHRPWDEVSRQIVDKLASTSLMLSVLHPRGSAVDVVTTQGLTAENVQEYGQFAHHDPWLASVMGKQLFDRALIGTEIVEERELVRSYMYNEFLRPKTNVHHLTGSVLQLDGGYLAIVGTHRPRDAQDFSSREARQLGQVLPHLRRALEVRQKLQTAEQATRSVYSVLDRLSLGVIMLGAAGQLLHVNAAADHILRSADGLVRTPAGLRACAKEDDRRLQALIAGLRHGSGDTRSAGGHLRLRRPSGRQPYAVMLAPGSSSAIDAGSASPAILVFVSDPGAKISSDLAILGELFGFPPAEGRLVLALLSGLLPPEFARKTGISYNTVRTLLGRAMARTGSRSQLELVLLVAGSIGGTVNPA
jgi:DNA-binding CsgD family transcriptional regulator